jgi:hypothetical protein
MQVFIVVSTRVRAENNMAKQIKEFTVEEYFKDYKFITNSHLLTFKFCPYLYWEKRKGRVKYIEKDYFNYGKGVDAILSNEDISEKFHVGPAPKGGVEELRAKLKEVEDAVAEREAGGKGPLKSQTTKMDKLAEQIDTALATEGKIRITEADMEHIKQSAQELRNQPLYKAFDNADTQTIIATEIDGVKVKCMLDKLDLENSIINDDKTAASIVRGDFESYLHQLAWYRWIVKEVKEKLCDCYLSVADKNKSKNLPFKRSALYYAPPAKLDYSHEMNMEELEVLTKAIEKKDMPPCVDMVMDKDREEVRQSKCFECDHYQFCPHSRQKEFIIL